MKIELQYPYTEDWKYGYLQINPEGRRTVILYSSRNKRSSTQYARYLLAVKEGRYLTEWEEADHIDEDFTNDDISNLQILSIDDHRSKSIKNGAKKSYIEFTCVCCGHLFLRRKHQVTKATKYCSRECSWKSNPPPGGRKDKNQHKEIDYKQVQTYIDKGFLDTEIARLMGISKSSVLNYRTENNIPSERFKIVRILEENISEIRERLLRGEKKIVIYKSYGCSKNVFNRFVKKHNLG